MRLMLKPPEGFQHQAELAAERGWLPAALLELPVAPVLAARPGAGGAGLEQNAEGGWSSLPEPAGTLPPVTAQISSRDMLAAAEEEERNSIGGETWIFFIFFFPSFRKLEAAAGSAREKGRDHHICVQLNTRKGQKRSNKGVFNPVLFLRGTWRRGAISKCAGSLPSVGLNHDLPLSSPIRRQSRWALTPSPDLTQL